MAKDEEKNNLKDQLPATDESVSRRKFFKKAERWSGVAALVVVGGGSLRNTKCQFPAYTDSEYSDVSGGNTYNNYGDYSAYSEYGNYSVYGDYTNYGEYGDYSNYGDYSDYGYGDYSDYCIYCDGYGQDYSTCGSTYCDYTDYSDYS